MLHFKKLGSCSLTVAGLMVLPVLAQDVGRGASDNTNSANNSSSSSSVSTDNGSQTNASANTLSLVMNSGDTSVDAVAQAQIGVMSAAFDRLFMLREAQGNLAEIMTSRLALQKSRNPQVRQLAQHLIDEHSVSNTVLTQAMRRKGVPIPQSVGAMNTATYQLLSRLSRDNFDKMYLAALVEAHENAVVLLQQELAQGQDADARAYVNRFLPRIVAHTAMIYNAARAVNAPGISERPAALLNAAATVAANTNMSQMNGMSSGNASR